MFSKKSLSKILFGSSAVAMLALTAPTTANAQYVANDPFNDVTKTSSSAVQTANKAPQKTTKATHTPGISTTSAPSFGINVEQDATVIQGVNTAGTVRVNMLANLEALLNIGANGTEIIGVVWGCSLLVLAFIKVHKVKRVKTIIFAVALITVGISTPSIFNYFIDCARCTSLFS